MYCKRLVAFANKNSILFDGQYGFRSKLSTSLAIAERVELVTTAIDEKQCTVGVFIDFKKAFDTINHEILL